MLKSRIFIALAFIVTLVISAAAFASYERTADNTVPAYTDPELRNRIGNERVDAGDRLIVFEERENAYYVRYPVRNGTKDRWVPKSVFNDSVNHDPQGGIYAADSPAPYTFHVRGIAFDEDNPTASVRLHVYIGGTPGSSVPQYEIRTDGNSRIFEDTRTIDRNYAGRQLVHIYALNDHGSGGTVELWNGYVEIQSDGRSNAAISPSGYAYPLGRRTNFGNGHDCAIAEGTPIYAIADGEAIFYQVMGNYKGRYATVSYGNFIELYCDNGALAKYAHLSRFEGVGLQYESIKNPGSTYTACTNYGKKRVGSRRVSRGDVIGYVGTTGNSTGPHLHFELLENGSKRNINNYFDR